MLDSRMGRAFAALALALFVWFAVVALAGTPALAANGHKFLSSLTQAPPGTPLGEPQSVAVDPSSGDVFVADAAAGVVDRFSAAGAYQTQLGGGTFGNIRGLAVDSSTGNVYVADSEEGVVDVFKPTGASTYELLSQWTGAKTPSLVFGEVADVAVDSSAGKVYVVDQIENVVDVFKATNTAQEGEFIATLTGAKPALAEPNGVAVSSASHKVYVSDGLRECVEVFNAAGAFELLITGKGTPTKELGEVAGVAVDEASGDVYVAVPEVEVQEVGEGVVQQFNAAGEWFGWLKTGPGGRRLAEPSDVAIGATGHVFVAEPAAGVVDEFGANGVLPDVVTGKSSNVTRTGATISGTINPLGKAATYHFEWGTTEELGNSTAVKTAGASEETVTATLAGLQPGTEYFYRLVGENENGAEYGLLGPSKKAVTGFETDPAVTNVQTGVASSVQPTSATLSGSLRPEGLATKYHFEYGKTTSYGSSSPDGETSAAGKTTVPVETGLSGLSPNTTYHYRLVAVNEFGTTAGGDERFTTAGPPRITSAPTSAIGHTTATLNAQINPGKRDTTYHFEYGESTSYGTSIPIPDEDIGSGSEPVFGLGTVPIPVSALVTGLKLATTYHFRVVASNSAGTVAGPDQEFTTVLIESSSAKEVTSEGATLEAQINPLGLDTTYHFEYGETTSYGTSIPVPDVDLGAVEGDQLASAQLSGLSPGTTYHYRVVATVQGLGSAAGPDRAFTTHASGGSASILPDGRAYEMVSPPDKQGGYIEPLNAFGGAIQASESGDAFAYVVDGPIVEDPEGNRSPEPQQVISTRDPAAWSSQQIVTPHDRPWGLRPGIPPEYQLFSSNLALGLVQPFPNALTPFAEPPLAPPLSGAERGHQEKTMYLRENAPIAPTASQAAIYNEAKHNGEVLAAEHGEAKAQPGYLPLVTGANVPAGTKFGGIATTSTAVNPDLQFLSATPDLSHVVLQSSQVALVQPPAAPGLYEWAAGKLQFVSVLPSGLAPTVGEPTLGYALPGQGTARNYRHAISDDGSRVVWANNETGFKGLGHLYLRDTANGKTLQLDAPEKGITEAEKGAAQFQIASADGSKVFFTDTQRLTADSSAAPQEGQLPARPDLYECDVSDELTCNLTDLTADQNAGENAAVQGLVLGASEDGSYVYLVATGALAPGAQAGANNLYVLHDTGTEWTTKFIARLSSEDSPDWFNPNLTSSLLIDMTSRVSPSGRYLAFMSNRSLTGYDNTDVNEETGRHADEEVFLYGADSEEVTCVSCNPSGARPRGVFDTQAAGEGLGLVVDRPGTWATILEEKEPVAHWLAGSIPGWTSRSTTSAIYQSRYLSDSGRLYFNSADPLVSQVAQKTRKEMIGGKVALVGVENVYEYEPNGIGGCIKASGCVALVSSGTSEKESAFLDASVSGGDVFFLTAAALLPQDQDTAFDVYDARVCTESSPCQTPPPPSPEPCSDAASCKGGSASVPTFQAPPSSVVPGNVAAATPKGQTLRTKTTKPVRLTRAQKLARALKSCRKLPTKTRAQKKKRAKCEAQAKKKYGAKKSAKTKKKSTKASKKGKR